MVPVTEAMLELAVTVKDCFAEGVPLQPPVMVKEISVVPDFRAVTFPEASTEATVGSLLAHAPVPPPNTTELDESVAISVERRGG